MGQKNQTRLFQKETLGKGRQNKKKAQQQPKKQNKKQKNKEPKNQNKE
jgi:hypothetical protein